MCLNETQSSVRLGKRLSDGFPIKIFFNKKDLLCRHCFSLGFDIRKLQTKQKGFKLSGTHQLLFYIDINMMDRSIDTKKKN
jgi:hypothetical protein